MEYPHMPKELDGFKWPGIVTLIPNGKEFPCKCWQEDWAVKEAWEGRGPTEWRCDLARGVNYSSMLNR